jgi:hypothetical protein
LIELNRRHSGSEQRRWVLVWFGMVWLAQLDDIVSFYIPKPDTYCILIESILASFVEDEVS